MSPPLILASASETRAEMLRAVGLSPEIIPARIDEEELKISLRAAGASPRDQADALAEMKALRVSARHPGALVIGADQVLDFRGEAFDKAPDAAALRTQLLRLRGERHDLHSAAVIAMDGAPVWRHIGRATLTMRAFSESFLDDYIAAAGPAALASVGGYQVEGRGGALFSRVDGDWFSILGLPLLPLLAFLRLRGVLAE